MKDPLCTIMGIADIIAGILIFIGFGSNPFGIGFALAIILKGLMSLI